MWVRQQALEEGRGFYGVSSSLWSRCGAGECGVEESELGRRDWGFYGLDDVSSVVGRDVEEGAMASEVADGG